MEIPQLTQSRLRELVYYNPFTGIFTWLPRCKKWFKTDRGYRIFRGQYAGKEAGHLNSSGYIQIRISGRPYFAHRLAFLYMTGSFPEFDVDHEKGVTSDNRWKSIRPATKQQNMRNSRLKKNNTSGIVGVSWFSAGGKWSAYITEDHKKIHLGYFDDLIEAANIRKQAEIKYGYHENHGRRQ